MYREEELLLRLCYTNGHRKPRGLKGSSCLPLHRCLGNPGERPGGESASWMFSDVRSVI